MDNYITSTIRTVVPVVVGTVAAFLAAKGVNLDPNALAGLTAFLSGLFTAVYYVAARYLEHKFPKAGYLLGTPKKPTYE